MVPNYPFAKKGRFGGKLTNATFGHLLRFAMLKRFKKSLQQIMSYKVGQFWAKLGQNCSFSAKGNFSEKLTNVNFFHFFCCFKKMLLVDHEVKGCINLGKIGPKLSICSKSGYFWEKQLVHLFCFVMLKCFNKILTADHER